MFGAHQNLSIQLVIFLSLAVAICSGSQNATAAGIVVEEATVFNRTSCVRAPPTAWMVPMRRPPCVRRSGVRVMHSAAATERA
ncbi:GD25737 [Drosophila simulans]|uniref:GD25737 n=1 Tax=Drosophila simulans TaxID=7240 RepID=B4QEU8_DROSI|nr:GD25737 [Drosophila simulans]